MRTFLSLLKISLNVNFGISALKYRFTKEKKRIWEAIAVIIGFTVGMTTVITMYSLLSYAIFTTGLEFKQPEIVLTVGFVMGMFIVLVFGIFNVMSAFYFSRDLSILVPLPLKPSHVMGSKFIVIMANEYIILLGLLVPPLILYGRGTEQGLFYWIKGSILILASPIIPLVAATVVVLVLMRFVNVRKSKDLFAILGGFLTLFFGLGINLLSQKIATGSQEEIIRSILSSNSGLVNIIGRTFPPAIWATFGLAKPGVEGLLYFCAFVGASVLLFYLLLWLGNRIFYRSMLSGQEVTRKRKVLSARDIERNYAKVSSPLMAVFWREWKLFLRTPVYVINGIAGMIMGPFVAFMSLIANSGSPESEKIFELVRNARYATPIALGVLAVTIMISSLNIVASTAISREGQTFWISKMIPVSPRQQIMAKLLHGISVEMLGIIITGTVLSVILHISAARIVVLFILSTIAMVLIAALNLMIDVLRPKLEWTNPQEAVKTNLNGLFGMLASMLVVGGIAWLGFWLWFSKVQEVLIYIAIGGVLIVPTVAGVFGLLGLAGRKYRSIET